MRKNLGGMFLVSGFVFLVIIMVLRLGQPAVVGGGGGTGVDDADYLVGTEHVDLIAEIVVGTTPGGELGGTWPSPSVDTVHSGTAHHDESHTIVSHSDTTGTGPELDELTDGSTTILHDHAGAGAPTDVDYLVGTADVTLSNEIVVGTTPGGELGGTWAVPTVDTTHSGSAHHVESHTAASHNDQGATGTELEDLTDGGLTTLHTHSGGIAADIKNGSEATIAEGSTRVVTFTTAFSSTPNVVVSFDDGSTQLSIAQTESESTTGFTIRVLQIGGGGGNNRDVAWIATNAGDP